MSRCVAPSCLGLTAAVAVCVLLISGCGVSASARPTPTSGGTADHHDVPWSLTWAPPGGSVDAHVPVEQALAEGALVSSQGVRKALARTIWLAIAPAYGVAAVWLDPTGQYKLLIHMSVAVTTRSWVEDATSFPMSDTNGVPGTPAGCAPTSTPIGESAILGDIRGFTVGRTSTAIEADWTTTAGAVYFAERDSAVVQRPVSGATSMTVDGAPGWAQIQDGISWIVLPQGSHETVIILGTVAPDAVAAVATTIYPHLDALFACC